MKINTDGVLLGAIANAEHPSSILDIGTGTGVIAMMLAQRFIDAKIDAVEIDAQAAETAGRNFKNSSFGERLNIYTSSIGIFLDEHPDNRYDLIVSNPPFYINSLESPEERKSTAKHTDASFFETLMKDISWHLSENGCCWLIFPFQEAKLVRELIALNRMYMQKSINIYSFEHSEPHRQIVCFGLNKATVETTNFVIYESKDIYTSEYKTLLAPYFLNF